MPELLTCEKNKSPRGELKNAAGAWTCNTLARGRDRGRAEPARSGVRRGMVDRPDAGSLGFHLASRSHSDRTVLLRSDRIRPLRSRRCQPAYSSYGQILVP